MTSSPSTSSTRSTISSSSSGTFASSATLNRRLLNKSLNELNTKSSTITCSNQEDNKIIGDNNNDANKVNNNLLNQLDSPNVNSVKQNFYRGSGYSVPYREKRNPLSSTRLSCYKPVPDRKDMSNLKNYKSVDDFLSLDDNSSADRSIQLETDLPLIIPNHLKSKPTPNEPVISLETPDTTISSIPDIPKTILTKPEPAQSLPQTTELPSKTKSIENIYKINFSRMSDSKEDNTSLNRSLKKKENGFTNKIRAMSDKTQKLFSKLYSSSAYKQSSSELCNDFIIQRTSSSMSHNRRSLSYGTLPGIHELEKYPDIPAPKQQQQQPEKSEPLDEEQDESNNDSIKTVIYVNSNDCEDGDSGILVNESGASSMLETDDVFYDHPSLPTKLEEEPKKDEFKLVRLKLHNIESLEDLGLEIRQMKQFNSENSRFEIAYIVPNKLVDR